MSAQNLQQTISVIKVHRKHGVRVLATAYWKGNDNVVRGWSVKIDLLAVLRSHPFQRLRFDGRLTSVPLYCLYQFRVSILNMKRLSSLYRIVYAARKAFKLILMYCWWTRLNNVSKTFVKVTSIHDYCVKLIYASAL